MQWIPCSVAQWISIECSGFQGACLNAVYAMQREEMEPYLMQWILCSMAQSIPIEGSAFHAASLNAVYSMQHGKMHPD